MENNKVKLTVNGKNILAEKGQTISETLRENSVKVPTLCYHSDLEIKASCRICVVEIKGRRDLFCACSTKISEGMEIITDSPRIRKARKINLELIFAQHKEECSDCIFGFGCRLLSLAKEYKADINRFFDRKAKFPIYQFGPSLIFDSTKCIDCQNCVEMCHKQGVDFLEIKENGDFFQIVPSENKKRDCIYCGQCLIHCPVGAFEAVGEFEDVEKCLKQKDKTVVFQFAPAVRASIGEEFGLAPGSLVTGKLVAGIKKLGAVKVFDVSVGADFTTIEESNELLERLEKGTSPCFSSCCPAWVKYVEFNYPEFIPNLATTRSPQIILGGLIKNYWAKKEGLDSKKIVVVSVMPCVSKKYEIERKELKILGQKPVDYVLTTRELAYLFLKHKINLAKIKPQKADAPLGLPSGAGEIYGASGGVVESVLRTIYKKVVGKDLPEIEFKKVRGLQGTKIAEINIGKKVIKIAIINGIGNAKKVLEELKKNPKLYDAVEVMACPGGCIGGGGQPVPTDAKIRQARAAGLYLADKKREIHLADENPIIKKVYQDFLNSQKIRHRICHTEYFKRKEKLILINKIILMEKIKTLALNKFFIADLAKFSLLLTIVILAPLANQQFITGTIVNAVLFISCVVLGIRGAVLLALAPSLFALAVGLLPAALAPIIPFIILGNVILILVFDFLSKKNFWLGAFFGAILKFVFLYGSSFIVMTLIFKKEIVQSVATMMSWPQFFTAILGGGIAYLVLRFLKK